MSEPGSLSLPRKLVLASEIIVAYMRVRRILRGSDLPTTLDAIRSVVPAGRVTVPTTDERLAHAVLRTLRRVPTHSRGPPPASRRSCSPSFHATSRGAWASARYTLPGTRATAASPGSCSVSLPGADSALTPGWSATESHSCRRIGANSAGWRSCKLGPLTVVFCRCLNYVL